MDDLLRNIAETGAKVFKYTGTTYFVSKLECLMRDLNDYPKQ